MIKRTLYMLVAAASTLLASCGDSESYAKLLNDQDKAVNLFLADQRVEPMPADNKFEVGPQAPYYVVDNENGIYMQVLDMGDMNNRVKYDQEIYFRYMAASLLDYTDMASLKWYGNAENLGEGNYSFRYQNFTLASTYQWGTGIQQPLEYLGLGCRVNLLLKSTAGFTEIQAQCVPYLFNVSYHPSQLGN